MAPAARTGRAGSGRWVRRGVGALALLAAGVGAPCHQPVDPAYDLQRKVMQDPRYDGFFVHDDDGKVIVQPNGFRFWDFRNASAVQYHTESVTGYFADAVTGAGVDAAFFDEGDAFACQYNCQANNLCRIPDYYYCTQDP